MSKGSIHINERLGDAPIDPEYHLLMNQIARVLDGVFNGDAKGDDRETGFVLMVFPFTEGDSRTDSKCNFISNGADRRDLVVLFKEMIARFEGQANMKGSA